MKLDIHIDSNHAACCTREDVLEILSEVSRKLVLAGTNTKHPILDLNGNRVGYYSISAAVDDDD